MLRKVDRLDFAPSYLADMRAAIILQAILGILAALVLDFGQTLRGFTVALLCQWALTWIILYRQPMNPTRWDRALIRYGIVPVFVLICLCGPLWVRWLGSTP
jgi:hypothetical protein